MTRVEKAGQVFECEICGNVVEAIEPGGGAIFCCGQKMELVK